MMIVNASTFKSYIVLFSIILIQPFSTASDLIMNFAVRLLCHSCRVNEFTDTCTRCKADKCDECEFDHDCDEESGERVMLSKATKVIDLTSPSPAKCSQADFAAVEKVNAFDGPIQP